MIHHLPDDPRIYVDPIHPALLEACQQEICDLWAHTDFPSSYEIARVVLMAQIKFVAEHVKNG